MIRQRSNEMDMLSGPIWNKLIAFALPIAITGILQQLFNAADVAVAGRFAGSSALAAVGANTSNTLLFTNFIAGSSVGANVVVAMLIGRGKREKVQKTVGGAIGLAIVLGLIMLALGQVISVPLLKEIGTPVI